jgi:hypothetical protein
VAEDDAGRHTGLPSHEATLQVQSAELPTPPRDRQLFQAVENRWNLYRSNGQYLFEMFDTQTDEKTRVVLLNDDFTAGHVHIKAVDGSPSVWSVPVVLRHVGELLVVNLLSRDRGLLVHACGVNDHGRGLLFVGRSGAGKTTLSNLYHGRPGVTILSDERMIISRAGSRFFISGTPWPGAGMRGSAGTVPLDAVFFIEHAQTNVLHAEKAATLAGILFQQLFLPFWDRQGMDGVLRFIEDLLQTVPAHRMGFVNDERVIRFVAEHGASANPLVAMKMGG